MVTAQQVNLELLTLKYSYYRDCDRKGIAKQKCMYVWFLFGVLQLVPLKWSWLTCQAVWWLNSHKRTLLKSMLKEVSLLASSASHAAASVWYVGAHVKDT